MNLMRLCPALAVVSLFVLGCAPRAASRVEAPGTPAAAPGPAGGYKGRYNNDLQGHADLCVRLRSAEAALRYADGGPSGYALSAEILVPEASNGVSCPERGWARLDAREIVQDGEGRPMVFHRGGWGFVGQDPGSAVHFGHVLVSDLDSVGLRYVRADSVRRPGHWEPSPAAPWPGPGQQAGNGSPCSALEARPGRIVVRSIPGDMKYLNSAGTGAIPYAIYGDPPEDLGPPADRVRGIRYTMLTWSWINTRGGGVARALVKDGEEFRRCADVPSISLGSVADAASRRITGWVRADYGAIPAGRGALLYGWLVTAHRHGQEAVVSHLR